ncbi:hypothetical protein [Oceanobacter mangrovi]|uniref:hypothetical protein n=1 Tax=Oceanobacter mangrovi TaxID=2862510 RepID=UPI001C8E98A8|nr:hypothetical protein [Oceanobacter mangrovi]
MPLKVQPWPGFRPAPVTGIIATGNIMKRLLFLFVIAVSACSSNSIITEKEREWIQKLQIFDPVGKSKEELFKWQSDNGVPLNSFPH